MTTTETGPAPMQDEKAKRPGWAERLARHRLAKDAAELRTTLPPSDGIVEAAVNVTRTQVIVRGALVLLAAVATIAGVGFGLAYLLAALAAEGGPVTLYATISGIALGAVYTLVLRRNARRWAEQLILGDNPLVEKAIKKADLEDIPAILLFEEGWALRGVEERLKDATTFHEWETARIMAPGYPGSLQELVEDARTAEQARHAKID